MCACRTVGVGAWPGVAPRSSTCLFESPNFCSAVGATLVGGCGFFFLISAISRSKQANRAVSDVSWVHAINESKSASPIPSVGKQNRVGKQTNTHSRTPRLNPLFAKTCRNGIRPHTFSEWPPRRGQDSAFAVNRPLRSAFQPASSSRFSGHNVSPTPAGLNPQVPRSAAT